MERKIKVRKIISDLVHSDEIEDHADLLGSGLLDSFQIINLLAALEREFAIQIPGWKVSAENFNNIENITAFLEELDKK